MALSDIFKKKINNPKFKELTGAETFGDFTLMTLGKKPLGGQAAENIKKEKLKKEKLTTKNATTKNNNKRKGISASILNQSNLLKKKSTTKKKTLLGG